MRVSGAPSQSSHSGPADEAGSVTKHRRHEPARAGGAESRLNRSAGRRAPDSTTTGRGLGRVRNSGTSSPRVSHMSRMVVESALRIRSSSSLARPLTRPSARACHSAAWCRSRWSLAVGVVSLSRGNGSTWLTSASSPCSTSRRSPLRAPSPRFACPTAVSVSRSIHHGRSARRLRSSAMQALHTNRSVARSHRLHLVNG
ncbi:Uncharacterised protein [Mycobacteroides abscessus subsp. abscessus]|nr:Uncharacterised protein [Mycobacteroides abscessus subsp. abscessus]